MSKRHFFIIISIIGLFIVFACTKKESDFTCIDPPTFPSPSFDSFVDSRDNHIYKTIKIGDQIWMAENLAYLPTVSPSGEDSYSEPYYYVYDYQGTDVNEAKTTSNYKTYGVLYNHPAAMAGEGGSNSVPSGVQGICPAGFHLPSDEEWKILEGEVDSKYDYPDPVWDELYDRGTDAGGHLKETGTTHWNWPNTGATNKSGFSALPGGGYRFGEFMNLGSLGWFWTSTGNYYAWGRVLSTCWGDDIQRYDPTAERGYSVRCIKNN